LFRYRRRQFAPISRGCVLSLHFNVLSVTRESPGYMFCLHSHHPRWSSTASQPCRTHWQNS
ncbi:hypothetical protein K503DRAFT_778022, partial [Rhizopogon vinicolor AM-OR11-026]